MADLIAINGPNAMIAAAPGWVRGKPNLEALWRGLGAPVSDLEAAVVWLQTAFTVEHSTGKQMDALGDRLNQPRSGGRYPAGESDTAYRGKLRAAVLRNRSMGTAPQLRAMVKALLHDYAPKVQILDVGTASMTVAVGVASALDAATAAALLDFMLAAKSGGVGLSLAWYVAPVFGFAEDADAAGFDDGTGTVGGTFANYL